MSENIKKRVALIGKNTIAVGALEILLSKNIDLVLVSPNNSESSDDGWQRSLLKFSKEKGLPVKQFSKINEPSSIEYLKSLELDYLFSIQYDQIIRQPVIDTAKSGAINLHFSPLPRYRGVSPIALALLNGEKEFGVTMHYMDPGVDTGDLISQVMFNIESIANARELYDLVVEKGLELFADSIDNILAQKNSRSPQDNSRALYFSRGSIDFKENQIDFNKDSRSLSNWIKAFIFPPFQYPVFALDEKVYQVVKVSADYTKNNFEKPGSLVFSEKNLFKFATQDSYIVLTAL